MTVTQINGGTQVKANTITSGQVDSSVIVAAGGNAFSGDQSHGGHKITSLGTPTSATDAATKGYVDAAAQGLSVKVACQCATTTAPTFTVASGSVTTISGTTVDGYSPAVNDYILVKDAPASTGGGSANSSQPGNGIYIVTGNTTNLSVSRATFMASGGDAPQGAFTFIESGTANASSGWVVSTPAADAAVTYGTTAIQWTQFSGAGEITVDATITKSGNQLSRPALTGDVTASTGSNATTIAASAVTLAKIAAAVYNTTPTASTLSEWDANSNLAANVFLPGFTSTATAGTTTTLTVTTATGVMVWTGSSTQTVKLPTTGVAAGTTYLIINQSSANVTVQSSGANTILALVGAASAPFSAAVFTALVATPTTAANWSYSSYATGAGAGTVTSVSVTSANGFAGTVATATSTPAITLTTSITGVLKGNGTAISAATAGTDYMAPSDFITRETPTGTVNGSNTSFTLANTPLSGTEQVFLNGVLQEPGAGNDYTISTNTLTYLAAPISGDRLRVSYQK